MFLVLKVEWKNNTLVNKIYLCSLDEEIFSKALSKFIYLIDLVLSLSNLWQKVYIIKLNMELALTANNFSNLCQICRRKDDFQTNQRWNASFTKCTIYSYAFGWFKSLKMLTYGSISFVHIWYLLKWKILFRFKQSFYIMIFKSQINKVRPSKL